MISHLASLSNAGIDTIAGCWCGIRLLLVTEYKPAPDGVMMTHSTAAIPAQACHAQLIDSFVEDADYRMLALLDDGAAPQLLLHTARSCA